MHPGRFFTTIGVMTERKCDGCGKAAGRVRIHQSVGNDYRELWLCESCARMLGAEQSRPAFGPTVNELLGNLVGGTGATVCPTCGTEFRQIRQTGRVGCANCYGTFRSRIDVLLSQIGSVESHMGRYPGRLAAYKRLIIDRALMKEDLDAALNREDYERAAELRDRIRLIEEAADG